MPPALFQDEPRLRVAPVLPLLPSSFRVWARAFASLSESGAVGALGRGEGALFSGRVPPIDGPLPGFSKNRLFVIFCVFNNRCGGQIPNYFDCLSAGEGYILLVSRHGAANTQ